MQTRILFLLISLLLFFSSCEKPNKYPKNIDHLVYTTSDLEVGIDEIEKLLGVNIEVNKADRIKLIAKIKTENRIVILE